MVTITLHCPHCQSDALVRNGYAPNGKQLYRCHSCRRQSRENPTLHAYPQARGEVILHASSRTQQSARPDPYVWRLSHHGIQVDQKTVALLPPYDLDGPRSRRCRFHHAGARRALVICAQKSQPLLDLDCAVPQDAASGRFCGWRSQQKDVSAVVGGHCRGVSPRASLHGLLGSVRCGDSCDATLCCGKRDGRDRPC